MSILLIGYGSLLRGDDAVGQRAAEAVDAWGLPGVRALARHQLTPELAEELSTADLAVFVDAAGDTSLERVTVTEVAPGEGDIATHGSDPGVLLALARALYGRCPRAVLVAIPVATFEMGETLSPKAEAGLAAALERIRRLAVAESRPAAGGTDQ